MIASTQRAASGAAMLSAAPRRFSHLLFGLLSSSTQPASIDEPHQRCALELADEPAMREVMRAARMQRAHGRLPAVLSFIPGRIHESAELEALGFADGQCASVTVDVALWRAPCGDTLTEITWRRVFTWVTGGDRNLSSVSVVVSPAVHGAGMIGSYGYVADGVSGYGVLHVQRCPDSSWRIVDCWGDTADRDRIEELAAEVSALVA